MLEVWKLEVGSLDFVIQHSLFRIYCWVLVVMFVGFT